MKCLHRWPQQPLPSEDVHFKEDAGGQQRGSSKAHPPPLPGHLAPHAVREPESPFATCSQAGVSLVSVPVPLASAYLHQAWERAGLQEALLCSLHCVPPIIAIVIGVHASPNQRGSLRGGAEAADTATAQSPRCFHHLLPHRPWKEVGVTVYALLRARARARVRRPASDLVP